VLSGAGAAAGAQAGAEVGAAVGAVAGAAAGAVYSQATKAADAIGKHIDTAIEHIGKLKGSPDQGPKRGWKQTLEKTAGNIDRRAGQIANKQLSNAAHFTADVIRIISGYF
jgi:phage tail tape-measure protein